MSEGGDEDTLLTAVEKGDVRLLESLVQSGADVNEPDGDGQVALISAAGNGHSDCVKSLLEAGANVNILDNEGDSALYTAADNGHLQCIDLLLKVGTDVNMNIKKSFEDEDDDSSGNEDWILSTPLMAAVTKNYFECVQRLVEAGADVNVTTKNGQTPLNVAAGKGYQQCLQILIQAGADVNLSTEMELEYFGLINWSAVTAASSNDSSECLDILLKAGANPDGEALLKAAMYGNEKCVDLLLKSGANVNQLDAWSDTPLILASRCGNIRIVDLLLAAGADVNITSGLYEHEGQPALGFAAYYEVDPYGYEGQEGSMKDRIRCMKSLLRAGAHVNIRDKPENHSALQHLITTFENTAWKPAKKNMKLLFAAGDNSDGSEPADTDLPDFLQDLVEVRLDLKQICRNWIRKYLLKLNKNTNLFVRVSKLGLPELLTQYLLYDMTLEEEDDDSSVGYDDEEEEEDDDEVEEEMGTKKTKITENE